MLRPDIQLIDDVDTLLRHRERIAAAASLGLDTEFVRERTYYPRPGLLQISDGERVWILDPVVLADAESFRQLIASLMQADAVTKILHSTGEDLEVLDRVAGETVPPVPLFDTQRAAALLGWPLQVRYEVLAEDLLGVEFPGGLGRNNWLRRPLPEAWIDYAAHDVIALPKMREELARRLADTGRLEWLEEDCRRIAEPVADVANPVSRIRGAAGLEDVQLERLERLARWREEQARERDLPRGFVVRDEALIELVRSPPDRIGAVMSEARGLSRSDRPRLRSLLESESDGYRRPADLHPLSAAERQEIRAMQAHVREVAESLGVEPPLLASRRDLTRLLQGGRCDWLEGWRGELLDLPGSGS
jgi:ribonuclease D